MDRASCHAVELLSPGQNWHPGPFSLVPFHAPTAAAAAAVPSPPNAGYYPVDLQSAYGLGAAAAAMTPSSTAPTVAIVDAYDDPNAASDLAAYRASMSGAQDPGTALTDPSLPPLCSATVTSSCVTFTKVNQTGGTTYPAGNASWSEEISLDLDMVSAVCPACNIVLVEASSNSYANLAQAASEAATFHPAAITNSYGGSEFSSETSDNSVYSATSSTAVTAAAGDNGYGVEFPAASPSATAVGGTTLTHTGTGASLVWNAQTAWSGAGSGCSAYEAMPSWQSDQTVYASSSTCTKREVADVAAVADPTTGVATYDTYGESGWLVFGGTSVSAQIIGAIYGLAAGSGALEANPSALYPDTGGTSTAPTPGLVPVSSGSNGTCGTYLCNAADSLASGYNGPTGLGTPSGIGAFGATNGSLSLSSATLSLGAGTSSGPLTVNLSAPAPAGGLTVSLATNSTGGGFSSAAGGPFTAASSVSVAGGSTQSASFYYEDRLAGSHTITASATGWSSAGASVSVAAAPLATITVTPSTATVGAGASQGFAASGADAYGNTVTVSPTWSTTAPGSLNPSSGASTTFTVGSTAGSGTVTAAQGAISGHGSVTVTAVPSIKVSVSAGRLSRIGTTYQVPLTVAAANATSGAHIARANVSLQIFAGTTCSGTPTKTSTGTTANNGQVSFTFSSKTVGSWCGLATVTASGYNQGSGQTTFST